MSPDIPASAKLVTGAAIPTIFNNVATTKPVILPINKEGAKIPPTPPGLVVAVEAKILKRTISIR